MEFIILSVILVADCTSMKKVDFSSNDDTTRSNSKLPEHLQSSQHHGVRKNFDDALTLPTSDPPDFMERYNLAPVTTTAPDKLSMLIASSFTTTTTFSPEYLPTKFTFVIPKLPTHPRYTFTWRTDEPPTVEPTTFWSMFFSAGFQNSKDLQQDDIDFTTTPEYGRPPAAIGLFDPQGRR